MTRARLVRSPIDAAESIAAVAAPDRGATALFVGTVRDFNDDRAVTGIDYSAYEPMALRELSDIVVEAEGRFGVAAVAEHRLGTLAVGEASVVIATAHARRAPSLAALGWIVEELKSRVPIWKQEHYADGSRAWVTATVAAAGSTRGGGQR